MGWYPGKSIVGGIRRQRELKQRGMDVPQPEYDPNALAGFQGVAQQGTTALAGAQSAQGQALAGYQDMAAGNGPSVAALQMQQGQDQAIANQMAMQAQGRSGNIGSQMQGAQQAGVGMQMQGNVDAAQLRAQEQQAAMAGAAGLSTQMAGQGLQQQLAGQQLMAGAAGQSLDASTQWGLGQRGLDIEQLNSNRALWTDMSKSAVGAAGMAIGLSDIRVKHNVRPSEGSATDAARAVDPISFEYDRGAGPAGDRTGIAAQDLASTPAGAAAVVPTEKGLGVDAAQLSMLSMAGNAETVKRLDQLEQQLGVSDANGYSYGVEPNDLAREVAEQDALQQRISEHEAIIEGKIRRGEPVDEDFAEVARLSGFVNERMRKQDPDPSALAGPQAAIGPYRGGGSPGTAEMRPWDDMARSAEERTIMRANDNMVRNAQQLADRYGPLPTGGGMRI